ncbi:MAG TPA: discoidin domain-containing protein [Microlunatus sp.]
MARHPAPGLIGTVLVAALVLTAAPVAATPSPRGWSGGVDSWITDLTTGQRLERQPALRWKSGVVDQDAIVVDPTRRYQSMTGFGASMTDSSAYVLSGLPAKTRTSIMTDLFSTRDGIGLSMLRQPMGASDFAVGQAYSYDDQPAGQTDRDLSDFSIAHDRAYILPRLREAYAINPELTFMASPWSAPGWMKDSDSLVQGSLREKYEKTYAQYFVKFIRAYAKAGIPTDYVSLQNEPLYEPEDYPGMGVMPDQAARFLGRHLGPALDRTGLDDTTILGYDHNWDITDYPEAIYHDRRAARFVPGTAWHCYGGEVPAQSVSHNNYPHAQAFLTECSGGEWQGTPDRAFDLTMDSVIGVPRNWGQAVILWNLALDQRNGPFIGGCKTCRGVVTVNDDGTVTRNLEYWALAHASRFVAPGAVRIGSSQSAGSPVSNVAYRNRDGSLVVVAHNQGHQARSVDLAVGDRHVSATLAPGAAATYRFRAPDRLPPAGDLGWVDLDYGRGPAGTPSGRLTASVGPDVIAAMSQVKLGNRWLAYALPYGAELQRTGATALDRTNWTVTATGVTPTAADPPEKMLDGNLTTRWSSGKGQDDDMSLTVDLGGSQTFTEVSLDVGASVGDYLRSYVVQVSDDKASWRSIARGPGRTGEMIIALPETTARYVRISSATTSGSWWSIAELNLRHADLATTPGPGGRDLIRDSASLADGSRVVGYYNDGRRVQNVPWPVTGFGYDYRLPATAAATFVVIDG